MLVMKFGGSSVANRQQIEKVLAIVRDRGKRTPVVVSSAHKGITNSLVTAARAAASGTYAPEMVIDQQRQIAAELDCPDDLLAAHFDEIGDLLRGIHLVKELSPRSLDYIASFGERMSVRCIADFFTRSGLPARAYDVWDLGFVTDDNFGQARPLPGYEDRVRAAFARLPADEIPVVTGFVGKNEAGEITTVGRNGSDLTATLLSAALGAQEVQIWTDTNGVMTADPSVVAGARNIPTMRFDEAAELAYFGSRVLHPSSLLPAMKQRIPVRVLNTNRPDHPGTVIEEHPPPNPDPVTSIAYKERQIAVSVTSTRMFGQAGFLGQLFAVLSRHHIVVDLVATSEVSISFTTDDRTRLGAALPELQQFGICRVEPNKTILVVISQTMAERVGLGAQVMQAMANADINVELLSHALGSINLSMLINDADIGRAVPVLHQALFDAP